MTTLAPEAGPPPTEPSEDDAAGHDVLLPGRGYQSPLHDPRVAAVLGLALGVTFTICFITGLASYYAQHPTSWFTWPARPAGLYRVTQGLHVASGLASIPLLGAKLWVVAPRFWAKPPVRNLAHAIERALLLPLVAGGAFLLVTGTLNTFKWYPWEFSFVPAHHWAAWITIGGLVAHIGSKAGVTWLAVRHERADQGELAGRADRPDRRRFLGGVAAAVGGITVATVGQTVPWLHRVSLLAPRDPEIGPQGLPVNKTFAAARIAPEAIGDDWRLEVHGHVDRRVAFTLAELRAMPMHEATLPIACVEGWSASATWRGVRMRDLLDHVGAAEGTSVRVESAQPRGGYRQSHVDARLARDPDTLLALELDGQTLARDHGYPVRLIAPARPGVLQTKWLNEIVVLR